MSNLPRGSLWLLERVLPTDRFEDVSGDLEEVHQQRLVRLGASPGGKAWAWLATVAETWLLAATFLLYRYREKDRSMPWISWTEVRLGLRLIRKQPLMSAASILALAMGIGIATTGFTVVDAMVNGKMSFDPEERFVRLEVRQQNGYRAELDLELHRWLQQADSFAYFGAADGETLNVRHPSGRIESLRGAFITASAFRYLPYAPRLGRVLVAADGETGAPPVVVLRESLWLRAFNGSYEVLGQTLEVGGVERTVVGVLSDAAGFPAGGELWLPLDDRYLGGNAAGPRRGLGFFGILHPEVSIAAAEAEVRALAEQTRSGGLEAEALQLKVLSFVAQRPSEIAGGSVLVAVLSLLLLVIAANIANLVLARNSARAGELAVRTALGAGRSRLIGQLTIEVVLLGTLAAGLGLAASQTGLRWIENQMAQTNDSLPFWIDLGVNPRVLAFVIGISLLASIVGGTLPALKATSRDPGTALKGGGRRLGRTGLSFGRLGSAMMVVETALAVAMLSAALVMASGLSGAMSGLRVPMDEILTARLVGAKNAPSHGGEKDARQSYYKTLPAPKIAAALEPLPGVLAVGLGDSLPGQDGPIRPVISAPETGESPQEAQPAQVVRVHSGFLEAIGAQALTGRLIQDTDLLPGAPPVAVVNEPFVARFFAGKNPLGRRIRLASDAAEAPAWRQVVGVVADLGLSIADPEHAAGFYVPSTDEERSLFLAIRTDGTPTALANPIRQAIIAIDPEIQVTKLLPLAQADAVNRQWMSGFGTSLSALGGMVMLLSMIALYAMISFSVTRRTREIGIRVTLGATRRQVISLAVGGAGLYLIGGGALGTVLALALIGLQDRLYNMRMPASETWVLPLVLGVMVLAGLLASWIPTRRALRVRPAEALRFD